VTTSTLDPIPDVGTLVRLTRTFETFDDVPVPVDPTTVTLTLVDPDGIWHGCTVTRESLGEFFSEFIVPVPGQYFYRWAADVPDRAYEGSFIVRHSGTQPAHPENLVVKRGRDFTVIFEAKQYNGTPIDLTGYSAVSDIRDINSNLIASFTVTIPTPSNGEIWCSLTALQTAVITISGFYDVKLTSPDDFEIDFKSGSFTIIEDVTP
jgi:hypothetical protein